MTASEAGAAARDDSAQLVRRIGAELVARRWSVAVAESCTGGLISKLLTDIPGSSRYLKGAVVAYANEAKIALGGVPAEAIREAGAVSEIVAGAMARGVAKALEAEVGLAVTGIAGPSGGGPGKPVGTVWFGREISGELATEGLRFDGDRAAVRVEAAIYALEFLLDGLSRVPSVSDGAANHGGPHG